MLERSVHDLPRASDLTDEVLVGSVLAGDVENFAVLMRRYNQRVFRIAGGILGSDAEAEDASQDAFIKAYEKLGQLTAATAFAAWVCRIAANMALLRLRRHRALQALVEREEIVPMHRESGAPSPDTLTYSRELRAVIEQSIDQLPDVYRCVLVMRDVEGMTTDEAAGALDIEPGTVRVRLHRARHLMRQQIEKRSDVAATGAFAFDGERCDRIVAAVFARL